MPRRDEREDEPAPKKSSSTLWIVLGGIALAGVTVCCCVPGGIGGYWWWSAKTTAEAQQKKVEDEKGIEITAEDLSKAYLENVTGADAKYKDKVLTVTGTVWVIDGNNVRLKTGMLPPGHGGAIGGVYCTFGEKHKADVTTLKLNERVTIRGYCTGQGFLELGKMIYCKKA